MPNFTGFFPGSAAHKEKYIMDISQTIARMKENPDFGCKVGMILVHNGVVRGWSRKDGGQVEWLEVTCDHAKIEALRQEYLNMD